MKKNIKIILFFLVLLFFCCANNIYAKAKSCKTHGDCLLSEFCDVNTRTCTPDRADNNSCGISNEVCKSNNCVDGVCRPAGYVANGKQIGGVDIDAIYSSSNCDSKCPSSYSCEPITTKSAGQIQYKCVFGSYTGGPLSTKLACLPMYFGLPIAGMQKGDCVSFDTGASNLIQTVIRFIFASIGTISVIIFIVAGFMIAFAAGNQGTIKKAKTMIKDTAIGLITAIFSGSILALINPDLVNVSTYTVKLPDNIEVVLREDVEKMLHKTNMPEGFGDPKLSAIINKVAVANHIDYCVLYTLAFKESSGQVYAIGHDEMVPDTKSYNAYCKSRQYYSGAIFSSADSSNCNSHKKVSNDDVVNFNDTENLGLDWRYSHGIGMMQITIFPGNSSSFTEVGERHPSPAYYIAINGKKYHVKDLFDPETSLNAAIDLLLSKGFQGLIGSDVNGMTNAKLQEMFTKYNGAGPAAEKYGREALTVYQNCRDNLNKR